MDVGQSWQYGRNQPFSYSSTLRSVSGKQDSTVTSAEISITMYGGLRCAYAQNSEEFRYNMHEGERGDLM